MKANFRKLSVRSLDYGAKLIIDVTNNNPQEAAKTSPVFQKVVSEHAYFAPLVPVDHYSRMSGPMKTESKEIIALIKGMNSYASGYAALFPGTEKSQAAQAVTGAIKAGGKLYNQTTGELDSRTEAVLTRLTNPEMEANLTALELTAPVTLLANKKKNYNALTVKRVDKESELKQLDTASEARGRMEDALKDYLSLVTAMRTVDGWQDLYADIEEVVKTIKRAIRSGKEVEDEDKDKPKA
ncbi:MAG TPA: hypothetical protein DDZ96_01710 [Porphyromonadaceae bacterium]|jgi:hypothetical protein|uniref:DUF6261 family protein n=1 Tax=Limibacterium fermenti TaxID=3229863 RepID=UPI000E911AA4|nr:hypothetical protein [Porphyromonadaceae bacterium]HBX20345.1 hypothetical protein [Porphyromonadaceae bacterium]HBX45982.1 hypothetical protein [Porphyromonadaceae bacterium]HCM21846.1 hypothetical protein [Porphyromonadaceae bacterium]